MCYGLWRSTFFVQNVVLIHVERPIYFELHVMEELFEHVSGILINLIMVIHTEK